MYMYIYIYIYIYGSSVCPGGSIQGEARASRASAPQKNVRRAVVSRDPSRVVVYVRNMHVK